MENPVINEDRYTHLIKKIAEEGMTLYVLFILAIFPLAVHDKYFDILKFRYELYWKVTCGVLVFYSILGLTGLIIRRQKNIATSHKADHKIADNKVGEVEETIEHTKGKKELLNLVKNTISKTDLFFFLFIISMGISTLFAPYQYEAFWGNRGRNQGFFIWIWFFVSYFLITRFYHPKKWHIWVILLGAMLPCIWGIVGFFLYDPLRFFTNVEEKYQYIFTSSFGNINTYSSYTGMMLAVSAITYTISKDKLTTWISFISLIIVSFAHIMSVSDNTVLSSAAVFASLPFLTWSEDGRFIRSMIVLFIFMMAMCVTGMIWSTGLWTMNRVGSSTLISLGTYKAFQICTAAILLIIFLYFLQKRKSGSLFDDKQYRILKQAFCSLLLCGVALTILILIYVNTGHDLSVGYTIGRFLTFNDDWGTGRGLSWRLGLTYYLKRMGLFQKLFGYGPDTYYIIMVDHYLDIMVKSPFDIFDSAHNEYIEYLITTGAFGLFLYLGMLITTIRNGFFKKNNSLSIAAALAVFTYSIQAVVNIAIPIVTPIFIVYMSIAAILKKILRKAKKLHS